MTDNAQMRECAQEEQKPAAKQSDDELERLRARVAELEAELAAARAAPEPIQCETCQGAGKINETLGGHSFSDPSATCPDCDGSGVIESIHDFRAGQWWVKALDEIFGSTSPHVTPDQKRAVAVVHNLLRHVANLGRVTAQAALTPEQAEKADEAIREALGDAYDCLRVWNAWSYGTMGPGDFSQVAEDSDRVADIRNAAAAALGFKVGS